MNHCAHCKPEWCVPGWHESPDKLVGGWGEGRCPSCAIARQLDTEAEHWGRESDHFGLAQTRRETFERAAAIARGESLNHEEIIRAIFLERDRQPSRGET